MRSELGKIRCVPCGGRNGAHEQTCIYYRKAYRVKAGIYDVCFSCGHASGNQHAQGCSAYPNWV